MDTKKAELLVGSPLKGKHLTEEQKQNIRNGIKTKKLLRATTIESVVLS